MVMRYLGGVNSPSYNPLAANVTTGTTVVQDGGVYTVASAAQANGRTQWVNDPFFSSDTILLQADNFANGSQNNTFLDSSTNNFTVTRVGNTTQGTFNPLAVPNGYWSNYFASATGYISAGTNTAFAFGTGNFTLEAWINMSVLPAGTAGNIICAHNWVGGLINFTFRVNATTGFLYFEALGGSAATSNIAVTRSQWTHVACVRASNVITFYINGVSCGGGTVSTNITSTVPLTIGHSTGAGANGYFTGYISNARIVKGTAVYTANFTPSLEPLTAITNTSLLTCQNNRFIDNSTNAFAITPSGDASVTSASPFRTSGPGQYQGSTGAMYFDGTGDYLTLTGSSNLAFGTGDFTIECWFSLNALPVSPAGSFIYDSRPTADGAYPCLFVAPTTNVLTYYVSTAARITGTTAIRTREWNYVVLSRVSGSTRLFLNGVQQGSTYTDATNYLNGASRPVIANNGLNLGGPLTGYISNLRVLNGTGVTTAPVPTTPLTAISGTQLLLNGTNAGIYDASARTAVETVGNAQVTTAIKKYGSGSMAFDGTGDWLLVPNSPDLNLGTGDFTIECWLNLSNTTAARSLVAKGTSSTTGWEIYFNARPTLFIFAFAGSITYSSNYNLNTNQWYHLAVVRAGLGSNNLKMFIDGFLIHEGTVTTDLTTTANMYVGAGRTTGNPMNGYIDDLRISKFARYTGPFIPPTVAMQDQG